MSETTPRSPSEIAFSEEELNEMGAALAGSRRRSLLRVPDDRVRRATPSVAPSAADITSRVTQPNGAFNRIDLAVDAAFDRAAAGHGTPWIARAVDDGITAAHDDDIVPAGVTPSEPFTAVDANGEPLRTGEPAAVPPPVPLAAQIAAEPPPLPAASASPSALTAAAPRMAAAPSGSAQQGPAPRVTEPSLPAVDDAVYSSVRPPDSSVLLFEPAQPLVGGVVVANVTPRRDMNILAPRGTDVQRPGQGSGAVSGPARLAEPPRRVDAARVEEAQRAARQQRRDEDGVELDGVELEEMGQAMPAAATAIYAVAVAAPASAPTPQSTASERPRATLGLAPSQDGAQAGLVAAATVPSTSAPVAEPVASDSLGGRRKRRGKAWFEEIFDEDYLHTLPLMTAEQTRLEAAFIVGALKLKDGAEILDVACGHGRHALELAARGHQVTGLDLSMPLLVHAADAARNAELKVEFVHRDMREIGFESRFDAAYCYFTSFGFFEDESNRQVAAQVAKALKPGGRFLLDVVNRDYVIGELPTRVWWQGGGDCMVLEEVDFNYYTSRIQSRRSVVWNDGRQLEQDISIRAYSLHEIGKLLHQAGFRVTEVSGGLSQKGRFFGAESRQILIAAEKK